MMISWFNQLGLVILFGCYNLVKIEHFWELFVPQFSFILKTILIIVVFTLFLRDLANFMPNHLLQISSLLQ